MRIPQPRRGRHLLPIVPTDQHRVAAPLQAALPVRCHRQRPLSPSPRMVAEAVRHGDLLFVPRERETAEKVRHARRELSKHLILLRRRRGYIPLPLNLNYFFVLYFRVFPSVAAAAPLRLSSPAKDNALADVARALRMRHPRGARIRRRRRRPKLVGGRRGRGGGRRLSRVVQPVQRILLP